MHDYRLRPFHGFGTLIDHHVDLREDLERGNDEHDDHIEDRRCQQRKRDLVELLPWCRSVDLCSLIIASGDSLNTGQQDDHVIADVGPYDNNTDAEHRCALVGKPLPGLQSYRCQHTVQDTEITVKDPAPYHGNGNGHGDRRQKIDHAEE